MRGAVSIVKESDMRRRVAQAVELVGGLESVIGRGDSVFIKPNLVEGHPSDTGETVHPVVLRTMVELAFKAGASEVLVGESFPGDIRIVEKEVREAGGVPVNLDEHPYDEMTVENPVRFDKVRLARPALECDVLVNVPTLKTHPQTGITISFKNYYGLIPREDKGLYHRLHAEEAAIVDLQLARRNDFILVDGTLSTLHSPPVFREKTVWEKRSLNLTLAGVNPVAIDAVSAKVMGVEPKTLRYLKWASEKGFGSPDLGVIDVLGLPLEEASTDRTLTILDAVNRKHKRIKVVNRGACTGCYGMVAEEIYRLREEGMEEDVNIVIGPGPGASPKGGSALLCGNCAAPTFYNGLEGTYLPGCPPDQKAVLDALLQKGASTPR